jgi:threonine synthase
VLAGWVAARCGLDIGTLVVGSNRNDILTRWLETGDLTMQEVLPTLSPSMDIQVSSNQERLLFELFGRDGARVVDAMSSLRRDGRLNVDAMVMDEVRLRFAGARVDDDETLAVIRDIHDGHGMLIDPHTAVGIGAARKAVAAGAVAGDGPVVCLATAHPAKFPDAVEQATGERPDLPAHLADLFGRQEQFVELPCDVAAVQTYIESTGRPVVSGP